MDEDGYPTEDELKKIREWPYQDAAGWFEYIKGLWAYPTYWTEEDLSNDPTGLQGKGAYRRYLASTAGWSGNEDIIQAMGGNKVLWAVTWYSSRRGGHYEFRVKRP